MNQIELQKICKSFTVLERPEGKLGALRGAFTRQKKVIHALQDISFGIQPGEMVGYIGPNGAGKSTTVKVMSGILTPDSGACTILERIPWKERIAHVARIGVVFGQRSQLWWDVPVRDSMELLRDMYRVSRKDYELRLDELVGILEIGEYLETPVRQLSLGQRMRCEIAAALLHRPEIIFLDEPTIGLDSVSKIALREFLKRENQQYGITMILTTHDMDDVDTLCNRVMVIGKGQLLYDGALGVLKQRYAGQRIVEATVPKDMIITAQDIIIEGADSIRQDGEVFSIAFHPAQTTSHAIIQQAARQLPVQDIQIKDRDIDEIIAVMYQEMGL